MEDKITRQRDNLLLEAQRSEFRGEEEKAIKKYTEAYDLGAIEAGYMIAWIYLRIAVIKKSVIAAHQSYEWFKKIYQQVPQKSIDGIVLLWQWYRGTSLDTTILQFMNIVAKQGDKYAQLQLKNIQEKL